MDKKAKNKKEIQIEQYEGEALSKEEIENLSRLVARMIFEHRKTGDPDVRNHAPSRT